MAVSDEIQAQAESIVEIMRLPAAVVTRSEWKVSRADNGKGLNAKDRRRGTKRRMLELGRLNDSLFFYASEPLNGVVSR